MCCLLSFVNSPLSSLSVCETLKMTTCYSTSVADAIKSNYNLSSVRKEKYRFIDISQFLQSNQFRLLEFDETIDAQGQPIFGSIPSAAQPYAALSYPWRDLKVLESAPAPIGFQTTGLNPKEEPITSIEVLTAVCTAAQNAGCNYLWMDKLCFRQDYDQEGIDDRAWHMKRMYSVYANCKVCLVAAGGMLRLPRLIDATSWINRAWTLQEALAPPEVQCLFVWNSGDKVIDGGNMQGPAESVLTGVGIASLGFLLHANLHSTAPTRIKVKDEKGVETDRLDLPQDPDSTVYLFGYGNEDNHPIRALLGALERPNPVSAATLSDTLPEPAAEEIDPDPSSDLSARRLGIWRCISLRSARYAEDFVFATMGIFGVTVSPLLDAKTNSVRKEGYPEDEIQQLLDNYLRKLSEIGSRADWFAVAPELGPARETSALPLVPDINYMKDKDGRLATPVKKLLSYWDQFNWYLGGAVKFVVDAPNGIEIKGRARRVELETGKVVELGSEGEQSARKSGRLVRRHDGAVFAVSEDGDGRGEKGLYAIVIGRKSRYRGGAFPPIQGDGDVLLLMIVEYISFTMQRYRNIGYAWVDDGLANDWEEKTLGVGLRGG